MLIKLGAHPDPDADTWSIYGSMDDKCEVDGLEEEYKR
jgi:hypothetical protein